MKPAARSTTLTFSSTSALWAAPRLVTLPDRRATLTMTRREPAGIVLAITPWNDPLLTPARKLAPALIAGNAVILKPASETPLVALHLARALNDAGLPAGALSTVTGRGSVVVPTLLEHTDIKAISFTGSTETGMAIRAATAHRNIRLQNEMGGKNASVICADADLDNAVSVVVQAAFAQAGQRCTATSRLLVARAVHDEVVIQLVAACEQLRLGPGTDPTTGMGPLVSRAQQANVLRAIGQACEQGAKVACGGGAPEGALSRGCYVQPTVLSDVTPEMAVWREEIFAPCLRVCLRLAGRGGHPADERLRLRARRRNIHQGSGNEPPLFAEADAGQIAVNLATSGWDVHIPFGGFRDSGSAFKEQGIEALHFYTRTKVVSILADVPY